MPKQPVTTELREQMKSFQDAVDAMVQGVTRASMPLQRDSFSCCVGCFDNNKDDYEAAGRCVSKCQSPAERFAQGVQREIQTLQSNIQGCQQTCFNRFASLYTDVSGGSGGASSSSSSSSREEVEKKHEECVAQCFQQFRPNVAEIGDRLADSIRREQESLKIPS